MPNKPTQMQQLPMSDEASISKEVSRANEELSVPQKDLDHLGLVAQAMKDLEISSIIDQLLGTHQSYKTTMGERVCAMVLHMLSEGSHALYKTPKDFEPLPLPVLFDRQGCVASDYNDDSLGRCLDRIHKYGSGKLFENLSLSMLKHTGLGGNTLRLDSTSMMLQGKYKNSAKGRPKNKGIRVTHGFSKDKRPDLKQVMLTLVTTGSSNLPVIAKANDGNTSDKTDFTRTIIDFCKNFEIPEKPLWIADSALYTKGWLNSQSNSDSISAKWLTRVPETVREAKKLVSRDHDQVEWVPLTKGYSAAEFDSNYGDVEQKWYMFFSRQAYEKEIETLERQIEKELESFTKKLDGLSRKVFHCEKDANIDLINLIKTAKYHVLDPEQVKINQKKHYKGSGRPKKGQVEERTSYTIKGGLKQNKEAITSVKNRLGKFILATNHLDISSAELQALAEGEQDKDHLKNLKSIENPQPKQVNCDSSTEKHPRVLEAEAIQMEQVTVYESSEKAGSKIPEILPKDQLEIQPDGMSSKASFYQRILDAYKELQGTEQAFKFLKDKDFMLNRFFLHKESRIEALMMIMAIALFVCGYILHALLGKLNEQNIVIPDPEGRTKVKNTVKRLVGVMKGIKMVAYAKHTLDLYKATQLKPI